MRFMLLDTGWMRFGADTKHTKPSVPDVFGSSEAKKKVLQKRLVLGTLWFVKDWC